MLTVDVYCRCDLIFSRILVRPVVRRLAALRPGRYAAHLQQLFNSPDRMHHIHLRWLCLKPSPKRLSIFLEERQPLPFTSVVRLYTDTYCLRLLQAMALFILAKP